MHFIDVGQADAILLEFPCAAMLVDLGAEKNSPPARRSPSGPPGAAALLTGDAVSATRAFDGVEALKEYLDAFFDRRPDPEHRTAWPACCGTGPRPAPGSLDAALLNMASAMLPLLSPRLRGSARAPAPRDDTSSRSVL